MRFGQRVKCDIFQTTKYKSNQNEENQCKCTNATDVLVVMELKHLDSGTSLNSSSYRKVDWSSVTQTHTHTHTSQNNLWCHWNPKEMDSKGSLRSSTDPSMSNTATTTTTTKMCCSVILYCISQAHTFNLVSDLSQTKSSKINAQCLPCLLLKPNSNKLKHTHTTSFSASRQLHKLINQSKPLILSLLLPHLCQTPTMCVCVCVLDWHQSWKLFY